MRKAKGPVRFERGRGETSTETMKKSSRHETQEDQDAAR